MAKSNIRNIAVWIVLGLLFVGLIGFGGAGLSGTSRTIGKVGDKSISLTAYRQALNSQMSQLQQAAGQPISFAQAQSFGLDQQVLSTLVTNRAVDNEAANIGLSVGDDLVGQSVLGDPSFQSPGGGFDREAYAFLLERAGLTEGEYEAQVRDDVARNILQGALIDGIPPADTFATTMIAYVGQERTFDWLAIDDSPVLSEPSEADLAAIYEASPLAFTAPEVRRFDTAVLTPAMIQDELEIDEEALRALYEERIDRYVRAERRLVERLVFADETAAQAAAERLFSGEVDFDTLVTERGLALTDVDLGDVSLEELGDAGADVFGAFAGDVVGPLPSTLGPALFRMNAVLAAQETPFETARTELREDLAAERARRVIDDQREGIEDLIAGGAGAADLGTTTAMEAGTLEWSVGDAAGLAAYAAVQDAAAAAEIGDFPELIELDDGGLALLTLTEVVPPALEPFEDVRADVVALWEAQETQRLNQEAAEALAQTVRDTGSFPADGDAPQRESNLSRRNIVPGAPEGFVSGVFEMDPSATEVIATDTGAIVVQLVDIFTPEADDPELAAQRDFIAQSSAEAIALEMFSIYQNDVRQDTDVRLNTTAIQYVNGLFQ